MSAGRTTVAHGAAWCAFLALVFVGLKATDVSATGKMGVAGLGHRVCHTPIEIVEARQRPRLACADDIPVWANKVLQGDRLVCARGANLSGCVRWPHGMTSAMRLLVELPLLLNDVTVAELVQLPGVGPSLAQRIVDTRANLGGFVQVDDLKRVRGIGPALMGRLRPMVSVTRGPYVANGV